MWREVDLRGVYLGERIIGFSSPVEEQLALISYEGIHILNRRVPRAVQHDIAYPEGDHLYDRTQQILSYGDTQFRILGLFGGVLIVRNARGEKLELAATEDMLWVRNAAGEMSLAYRFVDLSGDWRYATFSPDGNVLVLGMPYKIHIFEWRTT